MRLLLVFCCFALVAFEKAEAQVPSYSPDQVLSLVDQRIRQVFGFPNSGPLTTEPAQWMSLTFVGLQIPDPAKDKNGMHDAIDLLAVACPPADQSLGTFSNTHRLDQVYEVVLTQTALFRPNVSIPGLKEAQDALVDPATNELKPEYVKYLDFQYQYDTAADEMAMAKIEGASDDALRIHARKLQRILDQWIQQGYKNKLEPSIDKVYAKDVIDAASSIGWRGKLLSSYRNLADPLGGPGNSATIPRSYLVPGVENWSGEAGWVNFKLSKSDSFSSSEEEHYKNSRHGSASGGGFFWKANASFSRTDSKDIEKSVDQLSNLTIEFSVRRSVIKRPWFDQRMIFEPGFWTWLKPVGTPENSEFPLLSKGKDEMGYPIPNPSAKYSTYTIPIPVVPSEVIVARKLRMLATVSRANYDKLETESKTDYSGGGSGGFLFWRVGASGGGSDWAKLRAVNKRADSVDFELTAEGPVVIGLISNVVPQMPNPRTGVWPSEAWLPK